MLLLAAMLAIATPTPPNSSPPNSSPLDEAARAIIAGRLDQARLMIAVASAGPRTDRLRADLAFAARDDREALRRYANLAAVAPSDLKLAERAGIAALRANDTERAAAYLAIATAGPAASWQSWNGLAVLADRRSDWPAADAAYSRAAALAPDEPGLANNRGWSLLLRGDWVGAEPLLAAAAARAPTDARIANNLQVARAAIAAALPARSPGEDDRQWAARLNDAGVAALLRHDRPRAIAAFSQAIAARDDWYQRAANNLTATTAAP